MAGTYNFSVFQGEDFDRTLTWSTSDVPVSQGGTPVDLTGYNAVWSMDVFSAFITTTETANGVITLGGDLGTIRVQMPPAALRQFTSASKAVKYKLLVTAPSTETLCLLAGNFKVKP